MFKDINLNQKMELVHQRLPPLLGERYFNICNQHIGSIGVGINKNVPNFLRRKTICCQDESVHGACIAFRESRNSCLMQVPTVKCYSTASNYA